MALVQSVRGGLIVIGLLLASCSKGEARATNAPVDAPLPGHESAHAAPQAAYVIPAELVLVTTIERGSSGDAFLTGTTNLPDGTKLGAEVPAGGGQDYSIFVANGQFRSEGFSNKGSPISDGPHKIKVLTYFNEAWQAPAVLAIVGKGGVNLKGKLLKLEDPTVSDSGKIIDETRTIVFPPVGGDSTAIALTKKAILTVDGRRSADDIEDAIAFFMKATPSIKESAGWSAKSEGGTKYTVSYNFLDGTAGNKTALWSADTATRKVTYVNSAAEIFSWTPED